MEGYFESNADSSHKESQGEDMEASVNPASVYVQCPRPQAPHPGAHWVHTLRCLLCEKEYTLLDRQHHCRACGRSICDDCSHFLDISERQEFADYQRDASYDARSKVKEGATAAITYAHGLLKWTLGAEGEAVETMRVCDVCHPRLINSDSCTDPKEIFTRVLHALPTHQLSHDEKKVIREYVKSGLEPRLEDNVNGPVLLIRGTNWAEDSEAEDSLNRLEHWQGGITTRQVTSILAAFVLHDARDDDDFPPLIEADGVPNRHALALHNFVKKSLLRNEWLKSSNGAESDRERKKRLGRITRFGFVLPQLMAIVEEDYWGDVIEDVLLKRGMQLQLNITDECWQGQEREMILIPVARSFLKCVGFHRYRQPGRYKSMELQFYAIFTQQQEFHLASSRFHDLIQEINPEFPKRPPHSYILKKQADPQKPLGFPMSAGRYVSSIEWGENSVFSSAMKPILIACKTCRDQGQDQAEERLEKVIYKRGDDLRQDDCVMQAMKKFSDILNPTPDGETSPDEADDFAVRFVPYGVLPIGEESGFIQYMDATPLQKIREDDSMNVKYGENKFYKWLELKNEGNMRSAVETVLSTLAGHLLLTYILGVGDRHQDNILISDRGEISNIDFGFILGTEPLVPKLIGAPPMSGATADIWGIFGQEEITRLKSVVSDAYLKIREHAGVIADLLILGCLGMPQGSVTHEGLHELFQLRFHPDKTDDEARRLLLEDIDKAIAFSNAARGEFLGLAHDSGQLVRASMAHDASSPRT